MRNRIRALIVVIGVAGAFTLAAAPAFAQEEEPEFASHAAEECAHLLEAGGEPDDCLEAPSPLQPELNEILWGSAAFLVLLVFMWKFGVPAVKSMMAAREDRIRNDLEKAEESRVEAEGFRSQYESQLADARTEAGRIVEEARQAGESVRRDVVARAETEASEIRARAEADTTLQRERAMSEIRADVAQLAVDLAERIVERSLDRDTQLALVDSFIQQVPGSK